MKRTLLSGTILFLIIFALSSCFGSCQGEPREFFLASENQGDGTDVDDDPNDEISTGGTLLETVGALKKHGAQSIYGICIHPVFAHGTEAKVDRSALKELVVTNTLPFQPRSKKIKVLSIGAILAEAIRRVHQGASVSSLFV